MFGRRGLRSHFQTNTRGQRIFEILKRLRARFVTFKKRPAPGIAPKNARKRRENAKKHKNNPRNFFCLRRNARRWANLPSLFNTGAKGRPPETYTVGPSHDQKGPNNYKKHQNGGSPWARASSELSFLGRGSLSFVFLFCPFSSFFFFLLKFVGLVYRGFPVQFLENFLSGNARTGPAKRK